MNNAPARPNLAVWKLASCDGCQLSLLALDEQLLDLARQVNICYFPEMTSAVVGGPYDISLVEGSVTTAADADRLQAVRAATRVLVTIGACATAGGIQSLRNYAAAGAYVPAVYAEPSYIESLSTSTPVSAHVAVDFSLHGCPVDGRQLLEVITAFLASRSPRIPGFSVCHECKAAGHVCLLVSADEPCLGPVTRAGCGALCPGVGRACFGCFGPAATVNTRSLARRLAGDGATEAQLVRLFRKFTAAAPEFAKESTAHDA
jgi:sulfhydrogenase subunit delta